MKSVATIATAILLALTCAHAYGSGRARVLQGRSTNGVAAQAAYGYDSPARAARSRTQPTSPTIAISDPPQGNPAAGRASRLSPFDGSYARVGCFSYLDAFDYSDIYGCVVDAPEDPIDNDDTRPRRRGPSVDQMRRSVVDRAIALAPSPNVKIAPARIGLTGLPTFFWVTPPDPITATAGVRGVSVTATAAPSHYIWSFGDGAEITTDEPGLPWTKRRSGSIEHTYETKGRYEITATIVWSASWSLNGGPPQSLGTFTTSDSAEYPVREVIAFLMAD